MDEQTPRTDAVVWEVSEEMIDLDQWARTFVAVRRAEKKGELSPFVRYGMWPIMALVVIVLGATSSVGLAVQLALFLAVMGGAVWYLNATAAARMAKRLHAMPAASEPFTFWADPTGTHSRSASVSEDIAWPRWKTVSLHDDLIVLTLEGDMLRMLPVRGLSSGHAPVEAVEAIAAWISAARPAATPPA